MLAQEKVPAALAFIDKRLGERITLEDIAAALEVSPHHFARIFKRVVGLAPHQYVLLRRLERAKELLHGSDMTLSEIAFIVGCTHHSHFSAFFHRETGVTPAAYRARHAAAANQRVGDASF
jgi:AraC family transcriptional regulator